MPHIPCTARSCGYGRLGVEEQTSVNSHGSPVNKSARTLKDALTYIFDDGPHLGTLFALPGTQTLRHLLI